MNPQLGDTQKVPYAFTLVDADGNTVPGGQGRVVTVASSDTDSATIVPDASPTAGSLASGFVVGGKKLATGLTITATVTKEDGTTPDPALSVVDTIDIVAGAAVSALLSLGTPVAQ